MSHSLLLLVCALVHYSSASFLGTNTTNPHASSILPVPDTGAAPVARDGAILAGSKEGFVLLGGAVAYGDNIAWMFNESSSSWHKLNTNFPVAGACSAQDGDFVYLFGGSNKVASDVLYRYTISKDFLQDLNVTAPAGFPTTGVSCGFRNNTFYLFGGKGATGKIPVVKYDVKANSGKWAPVEYAGNGPDNTVGASGLVFGDNFLLWGGSNDVDVWTFNLVTETWAFTPSQSAIKPVPRAFHSAVVDTLSESPSFIFFGGTRFGSFELYNDFWAYEIKSANWTLLHPEGLKGFPAAREMAASAYVRGRMFISSGSVQLNGTVNDLWQFVRTEDCYSRIGCDACVNVKGCGWCGLNNQGYQCLPGVDQSPYIPTDCPVGFSTDLTICPPDGFPGWIVAIIIVASIFLIGIVWYLVIRCQKKSGGYEQIN